MIRRFVIHGAPATKKTSQVIARRKDGTPFILPSKKSSSWEAGVASELHLLRIARAWPTFEGPVRVAAVFVRRTNSTGDLVGYMQALGDALQASGLLANDRQIRSWDGTRLRVDKQAPRVEVTVEDMDDVDAGWSRQ